VQTLLSFRSPWTNFKKINFVSFLVKYSISMVILMCLACWMTLWASAERKANNEFGTKNALCRAAEPSLCGARWNALECWNSVASHYFGWCPAQNMIQWWISNENDELKYFFRAKIACDKTLVLQFCNHACHSRLGTRTSLKFEQIGPIRSDQ
jgi:hypothetical protein